MKSSPDDKDSEISFQESELPMDYLLLGSSKARSMKASGTGNMDGNKNLNLHLMITCDSDDARNINQKEALHPEDDWNGMIESVDSNNNYEHNDIWENSCMVDSKKRTNNSNDDDGMKVDDDMAGVTGLQ